MEKDLTFEEAIQNLENIVNELETGKLTLDESVKKFEEGIKLSKHCNEMLECRKTNNSVNRKQWWWNGREKI